MEELHDYKVLFGIEIMTITSVFNGVIVENP